MFEGNYPTPCDAKTLIDPSSNRTIEENIEAKITMLKAEIKRLEESKISLAPLMGMKIRDIRDAMNY